MKQILLFISFIFIAAQMSAQNLEFDSSPVVISDINSSDSEGVAHSVITNTAGAERNLKWDKIVVQKTDGWAVAVCDKNQCFGPTVNTANFSLAASEGGTMDVHAYPMGNEGSAIIEVMVTDVDDENLSVSNLYYFNEQVSGTISLNRQTVKVYPNPSKGLFSIKGNKQVASVDIFNLTGVMVESFTYNDGKWYDISNLPKGTYLVRLLDRDSQQLVTKLINKL